MTPPRRRPNSIARALWIGAGLVACGLGFLGILLPGMPATVFFIAAAACFARSSDRLLNWVLSLPRVGPLVRNYQAGLGMPLSAKVWATVTMIVCVTISIFKLPQAWQGALVAAAAAAGAACIWTRVPTLKTATEPFKCREVAPNASDKTNASAIDPESNAIG